MRDFLVCLDEGFVIRAFRGEEALRAFYAALPATLDQEGSLPFCRGTFCFFAAFGFHFVIDYKAVAAVLGVFPDEVVRNQEGLPQPFASV